MVRKTAITLVVLMVIALIGCDWGTYPNDFGDCRWVAREVDMYFDVSDEFDEKYGCDTYGQLTVNGETTDLVVLFAYGSRTDVFSVSAIIDESGEHKEYIDSDYLLFSGYRVEMRPKRFRIRIEERMDGIIDDSITEITFDRIETPAE